MILKRAATTLSLVFVLGVFQSLLIASDPPTTDDDSWSIDSAEDWKQNTSTSEGLEFKDGMATPTKDVATFKSVLKRFEKKRSAKSIRFEQSAQWWNWKPIDNIGPSNLGDAPVFLRVGEDNYWMFGRYRIQKNKDKPQKEFKGEPAKLDGFDMPLLTTRFPKQFDAPGGLEKKLGGYHAWQSKDMVNWVHHGSITESKGKWMTTAEYADGKAYFYYDFPNDQDPHVYVDSDLFDGKPGENKGLAYLDPSNGSDCGIIRDLDGKFHLILEDWSPINARTHAWDSPLAAHAVSSDGIKDFKALSPPVDERTTPTGEVKEHPHPHWVKENPERFKSNMAKYNVHEPEQNAYGDWAAISIGGQYYLFCDYDAVGKKKLQVGWFTSPSIDKKFEFVGSMGEGHPDPDIMFAEGKFYLATQQKIDYVSPGPWVDGVEVRVGVDTDNDQKIDKWTPWTNVKETYSAIEGFSKQVAKTPAEADLSSLPEGFGFQFEVKLSDKTKNDSKPILEKVELMMGQ